MATVVAASLNYSHAPLNLALLAQVLVVRRQDQGATLLHQGGWKGGVGQVDPNEEGGEAKIVANNHPNQP